ncbi:MAG: porin [Bacteroidaceae bacterium]|nr:porin [Bacteroidaceae bacterium]
MKKLFLTFIAACLAIIPSMAEDVQYGRKITDYTTGPKVGGYVVAKYALTDQDGAIKNSGLSQRMARVYVDGSILTDFKYRVQVQFNNASFHMKDYFVEWTHWKEFSVKVGQYKRAFLFENPYNPWDVGFGDYSQITKMFAGMGDYCGGEASSNGGRDQGIQIQGDLLPMGDEGYRLIHYQLQLMNGQGINTADANSKKDFIGSLQVQPIKDLYIGAFAWFGDYTTNGITVDRNRWALSAKYEHNSWSARAEYVNSKGHKISEYNPADGTFSGAGKADGWYAAVGVPVNDWFKVYAKYDVYRSQASNESMKTLYSLAPNIQIHKNLMLQLQYNFVDNRPTSSHWNEIWAEFYFRF